MLENQNTPRTSPDPEKIRSMFSKVAAKYDKANSVLSIGIHHLWRKKLVKMAGTQEGMKVLDCATGTGDLAIEFKKMWDLLALLLEQIFAKKCWSLHLSKLKLTT